MVTPRYIFRGITQRHFTSSSVITKYLDENPQEMNRLLHKELNNVKFKEKDKRDAQERYYKENISKCLGLFVERLTMTEEKHWNY